MGHDPTPRAAADRRRLVLEPLEPRIMLDAPTSTIQALVDQVSEPSYAGFLQHLASYTDRNSYTPNLEISRDYIVSELESYGLDVELQEFGLPCMEGGDITVVPVWNIVATIPGTITPDVEYMLTAHYDSIAVHPDDYPDPFSTIYAMLSPSTPAPGADDNGSGSAALLESARVMAAFPFESTVRFVFFGAEEEGLVGSDAYTRYAYYEDPYAEELVPDPADIRGAINYDMIAYWDGSPGTGEDIDVVAYSGDTYGIEEYPNLLWLIESQNPELTPEQIQFVVAGLMSAIPPPPAGSVDSSLLGQTFCDAADTYGTGLDINYIEANGADDWWLTGASDHFNFLWYGWPSLLCIEDLVYGLDPVTGYPYTGVTSPYYHSVNDTFENCNALDMATATTATGVATISELAGLRVGVLAGGFGAGLAPYFDATGGTSLADDGGDAVAQFAEADPGELTQRLVVPVGAEDLEFDLRFLGAGGAEALVVEFDGAPIAQFTAADLGDAAWHRVAVDVSALAGEPGTLGLRLVGAGAADGLAQVDDVALEGTGGGGTEPDLVFRVVSDNGHVTVSIYDLVGGVDVDPEDVGIKFGSGDTVKSIKLGGSQPMAGLGIVISGADWVGSIKDGRKGDPADVAFIASDAGIGKLKLKSGLAGWDLNGASIGGLTFAADVDGDGDLADLTGLWVDGAVGSLDLGAATAADVWLDASLGKAKLSGSYHGDMTVGGSAGQIKVMGGFGSSLHVAGGLAGLSIKGGDLGGLVHVGGVLGKLQVKGKGAGGDLAAGARLYAGVGLAKMKVSGSLVGGVSEDQLVQLCAGSIGKVTVGGDIANARLLAGADLGADWALGGGDGSADQWAAGEIGALKVKGDVIDSTIGAGLSVAGDEFDLAWCATGGGFLSDGVIGKVTVKGALTSSATEGSPFGIGAETVGSAKVDGDREHPLVFTAV